MIPGEVIPMEGNIELNKAYQSLSLEVTNLSDRSIFVGSHANFAEVNAGLSFDRARARDKRLDIPAGEIIIFSPGERKEVELVTLAHS